MKVILLLIIIGFSLSFRETKADINGLWESKIEKEGIFGMRLKEDGSLVSYVNKKAYTSGRYTLSHDTITIVEDNGCNNAAGNKIKAIYKTVFFATDSLRFDFIDDSCTQRQVAVRRLRFGKVKK
jgi:hypothetical protein